MQRDCGEKLTDFDEIESLDIFENYGAEPESCLGIWRKILINIFMYGEPRKITH